ncbi:MAG: RusA family crossover junction endodeoxyribonuclease [Phycisphaerales bacterium]
MKDTIEIAVPGRVLSPNGRAHWRKKHQAQKKQKECAYLCTMGSTLRGAMLERARVSVTYYHATKRHRDGDNHLAMLKGAFDGIAAAGAVVNDSGFVHEPVQFEIDTTRPRVEITIEDITPASVRS